MNKTINARVYDPNNSLFKTKANEKAEVIVTRCSFEGECPLLKQGKCIHLGTFDRCMFGTQSRTSGYTKRATKYYSWIREQKEKYAEVLNAVKSAPKKMIIIGEYIYLPYSRVNWIKSIPFEKHGGIMINGLDFLHVDHWNIENIKKIIAFRPMAMMGGEITDYQKKDVPLFLTHLKEEFPELYKELQKEVPTIVEKEVNYVGRKAYLKTCKKDSIFVKSPDKPNIRQEWTWDGEKLTSPSIMTFTPFEGSCESKLTVIVPSDETIIEISDNSQVIEGTTKFVD